MVDLAISSHPAHSLAHSWYPASQEREKRRAAEKERKRQEAKERKKEEKQRQEEEKIRDARDREELRDAVARNIELAKKVPPTLAPSCCARRRPQSCPHAAAGEDARAEYGVRAEGCRALAARAPVGPQ